MATIMPVLPQTSVPPVALDGANWSDLFRRAAGKINLLLRGKMNATLQVTLAASTTSSTFTDSRIGLNTFVGLTPLKASAATALAAGIWAELGAGTCTLHHASNAAADQLFSVLLIG